MEKQKIEMFLGMNADKFAPHMIANIKARLEAIPDDKLFMVQSGSYQNPTTILIIAILLGWERFFLDDIALGIVKVLTCYGAGIWWLIDIFSAKDRTYRYNYNKFMELSNY